MKKIKVINDRKQENKYYDINKNEQCVFEKKKNRCFSFNFQLSKKKFLLSKGETNNIGFYQSPYFIPLPYFQFL